MSMRISLFAACAAVAITTAGVALAAIALPKPKALAVMHARHEGMESIGRANKAINRELQGSSPDLTVVRLSAGQIARLSRQASHWFPQGTGPDVGKTGAKPEIWKDPKDFTAKLATFQRAAQAFNATSAGNDMDAIKSRFADLDGACKSCHDKYRAKMKH
jgi:cytochrome c556